MSPLNKKPLTKTLEFPGNRGPLGIHVVPYCSSLSGRTLGLHVRGIDEKSRSKKENLFREDECIVQINDMSLLDKTFAQSQEVFRQAMSAPTIRLEVLPAANKPRYEKSLISNIFNSDSKDSSAIASPLVVRSRAGSQPLEPTPRPKIDLRRPEEAKTPEPVMSAPQVSEGQGAAAAERQTPTPPAGGAVPSPTLKAQSKGPVAQTLANLANRKGGKKLKIDLKKGTEGLGFTVVTRDILVHGPGPILVKNILQRGAAVKDGRLLPGDRILEVNGVDMTDRSQEELVAMLRSTKQGESVSLVVARQEDMFLPRELKGEEANIVVMEDGREQLMYEVPLNESGSAGLGVSLKGNKSRETGEDLGIFIKSIIHGGAAYKDGRLSVNDQLVAVNGESLVGRSNHVAMETLRRSMSSEGNARGTIQLVVLRAAKQLSNPVSSPAHPAVSANQTPQPPHASAQHNQVQSSESRDDQPPPPERSSSLFLPSLRRRASSPSASPRSSHSRRHKTPPKHPPIPYTHEFRRSGYHFGFREGESDDETGYARSHTLEDMRELDGADFVSRFNPCAVDARQDYTDDIRAMAGQMYGEPSVQNRNFRDDFMYVDAHSYALSQALDRRHHFRHSGGL